MSYCEKLLKITVGGRILNPMTIGILIGTKPEVLKSMGRGFSVCGCILLTQTKKKSDF